MGNAYNVCRHVIHATHPLHVYHVLTTIFTIILAFRTAQVVYIQISQVQLVLHVKANA